MGGGAARGVLFLDAGDGFEYREGAYHLCEFSFGAGVLTNKAKHASASYKPQNVLERVELLGVPQPSKVSLFSDGTEVELGFSWSTETQRITVRKPGVLMAAEWVIMLHA